MQREDQDPLGAALAALRASLRLKQVDVARAADLPASSVSEYESGEMVPTPKTLERLCRGMGLPPSLLTPAVNFVRLVREASANRVASSVPAELATRVSELAHSIFDLISGVGAGDEARSKAVPSAQTLWDRLSAYGTQERLAIVRENAEFTCQSLCLLLCEESVKEAPGEAAEAVSLAELALWVASHISGTEALRQSVQGFAWAFIGNARRVGGDLKGADEAFCRSYELWPSGGDRDSCPLDHSRRLDLEASLRRNQRRLPEALELLDRALSLAPCAAAGRTLIIKAKTLEEMGDFEGALATLMQAAPLVSGETNPRDLLCLHYNVLVYLERLGRSEEAAALIPEVRALTKTLGKDLDRVRLRWLEGLIAASLGRREEAVAAVREARDEFARRGIAYDAALATLELAVLYLEDGHTGEVKILAGEMAPIFKAQGVDREALAALQLFREAAEREEATLDMARRTLECLRRVGRER